VAAAHDLRHDLHGGTGFDPRQRSYAKHACHGGDLEGEAGVVWMAIAVARLVVKVVARYHSLDELNEAQNQFGPRRCATMVGIAAP